MYKGTSTSAGAAVSNGDNVVRIDSDASKPWTFSDGVPSYPVLDSAAFGSGLPGVQSVAAGRTPILYPKPVGAADPSGSNAISNIIANNAAIILWAGVVAAAPSAAGSVYNNPAAFNDSGLYFGLHYFDAGSGNVRFNLYNYDGTADTATVDAPIGTPVVIACRHDGNNLRVAKNGVAWGTAVPSGNTQDITGVAQLHFGKTGSSITTAAMVVCNAANSDADLLTVIEEMGALVGLSL